MKAVFRRYGMLLIQLVITLALITWLLRSVDWAGLLDLMAELRWDALILSALVLCASHVINIIRWQGITGQPTIGFSTFLVAYGVAVFGNNFLPSGIGGDGLRIALLSRRVSLGQATLSVALDRAIGMVALSALLGIGIWFGMPPGVSARLHAALMIAREQDMLLLFLGALAVSVLLASVCWWHVPALRSRLQGFLTRFKIFDNARHWTQRHIRRALLGCYGYSVVSHLLLVATYWLTLQSLGINLSVGAVIWVVLSVSISLLAPITINGLGLQESVFVVVLGSYGVDVVHALGSALLIRLLTLFYSLIGGLLFLSWGNTQADKKRYSL